MRLIQRKRSETTLATVADRAYAPPVPADAAAALATANPGPAKDLATAAVGTPLIVPPLPGTRESAASQPPSELAADATAAVRRGLHDAVLERVLDLHALADLGEASVGQIDVLERLPRPPGFGSPNYILRMRDRYAELNTLPDAAVGDLPARVLDLDAELAALARVIDGVDAPTAPAPRLRLRRFAMSSGAPSEITELRLTVPEGHKILGGGAVVVYHEPGHLLVASRPESPTTWYARGKAHSLSSPATLEIHVVALFDPDDQFEVVITESISDPGIDNVTSVKVAPEFTLVGGGAQIDVSPAGQLLTASFPSAADTWTAASRQHLIADVTTVRAYAIGLRARDGRSIRVTRVEATGVRAHHPTALAHVPLPQVVVGGGARTDHPANFLTASIPQGAGWRAASKDHIDPGITALTAHALALENAVFLPDDIPLPPPDPQPSTTLRIKRFAVTGPASGAPVAELTIPKEFKILGGGAVVNNPPNSGVFLTASFPIGFQTWRAEARNHVSPGNASITVTVFALEDPGDEYEVRQFQVDVPAASRPTASARVDPGFTMTGGGARVDSQGAGNLLTASFPSRADTWTAASKDHIQPAPAALSVIAIGVRSRRGVPVTATINQTTSAAGQAPLSQVGALGGHPLVGGGARLDFQEPGCLLTASGPDDSNTWRGAGITNIQPAQATVTVFAIGLANSELQP